MKYCSKCGKELLDEAVICMGCGCAVEQAQVKKNINKEMSYNDCVKDAAKTNIISGIILAVGVICGLFVSILIGAILCLVAEIVAIIPNSKVQKMIKAKENTSDKKAFKATSKSITKELKANNAAYKFSIVLAVISLVCLIAFAVLL